MRAWICVLILAQVQTIFSAAKKTIPKNLRSQKPINWNLSYYSEPFGLCKTLRKLDPVEEFRYHGVAVDLFRACGPRLAVPYILKYNLPAFGELFDALSGKTYTHHLGPSSSFDISFASHSSHSEDRRHDVPHAVGRNGIFRYLRTY